MTPVPADEAASLARSLLAALRDRDWDGLQRLCTPDYRHHAPRVPAADVEGYIATAQRLFSAFPDMTATVLHIIPANEWATLHYRAEGTHRAPFAGIPATGRRAVFDVLGLLHARDGRIAEGWFQFDTGELVAQLTAEPDGAAGPGGR